MAGRYVRVWVYGANEEYLSSVGKGNEGRTINEALAAYSQLQNTPKINIPFVRTEDANLNNLATLSTTASRGYIVLDSQQPLNKGGIARVVCDNGHLMNAVTDKCVGKMCEFAK